jgi:thiol-disulfide isomerase/thioredoxin
LNNKILVVIISILYFSFFSFGEACADGKPLSKGAKLPKMSFKDTVSSETMAYLGLSRKKNFSLDDMRGSLFIVEVFSTYCTSCPRNIPILNNIYDAIEKDVRSKGKIKIFGIAIGNNSREVKSYQTEYKVLFPVLTDYDFSVHDTLGKPRVPYTIYVQKTAKGRTVVDVHQGVLDSAETVLKKVRSLN